MKNIEDIEITELIIKQIIKIHDHICKGCSAEKIIKVLNKAEKLTEIDRYILWGLALNKNSLIEMVEKRTSKINAKMEVLEKQLSDLKSEKQKLGSLVCSLHGHDTDNWIEGRENYCKYCGERFNMMDTYAYLLDKSQQIEILPPKKKKKKKNK